MKTIYKHVGLLVFLLLFLVGCGESLEDTYKDFSGNGEVRYVGKCTDVKVTPGWQRLQVKWTNSVDPNVDKIKITWKYDEAKDSVLLDKTTTSYSINNLKDGTYEVGVCSVEKEGNESFIEVKYVRPYTNDHPIIMSFTRLVASHFFIKDRLVVFFSEWLDNSIIEASLNYTTKEGSQAKLTLNKDIVSKKYYLLPDPIDPTKPVTIHRIGKVEGSEDEIVFEPHLLENKRVYTSDFQLLLRTKYGFTTNIPDSWVNELTELEIDRDMVSFEDLLYFPNLKKVILGKNRHIKNENIAKEPEAKSIINEVERSNFTLEIINQLSGVIVERYNNHYEELEEKSYIKNMGATIKPNYPMLDLSNAALSVLPMDASGYNSFPERLIDNDLDKPWEPEGTDDPVTYQITIDLKENKRLSGLMFAQKNFLDLARDKGIAPPQIEILIRTNDGNWENATNVEKNVLGTSRGEVTYIPFSSEKEVRYVMIKVPSLYYAKYFYTTIGEIGLY